MRISPKKYAQSLLLALEGKSKKEAEVLLDRFLALLIENGNIGQAEKIISEFERAWDKSAGISRVEVSSAKELDKETRVEVKKHLAKIFGAKEVEMEEKVDPSIIGGLILREGDKILDGSVRGRMRDLREVIKS
jgi:F-type H+-transporting ATPase subunit delta